MSFARLSRSSGSLGNVSQQSLALSNTTGLSGHDSKDEALILLNKHLQRQGRPNRGKAFDYQQVNAVLSHLIRTRPNVSPDLIGALLQYDHDVNYSVRQESSKHIFRRRPQEEQPNDLVPQAALQCSVDVLRLLLPESSQNNKNEALKRSLDIAASDKVNLCLEFGAVLDDHGQVIQNLAATGPPNILGSLLQHLQVSSQTLDAAFQRALSSIAENYNYDAYNSMETLLSPTASGFCVSPSLVSEALIWAISRSAVEDSRSQSIRLIRLLLDSNQSRSGIYEYMQKVIQDGDTEILEIILEYVHSAKLIREALKNALEISRYADRALIIQVLQNAIESAPNQEDNHQFMYDEETVAGLHQQLAENTLKVLEGDFARCKTLLAVMAQLIETKTPGVRSVLRETLYQILGGATYFPDWLPSPLLEVLGSLLMHASCGRATDAAFYRSVAHDTSRNVDAANLLAHSCQKSTFDLALNTVILRDDNLQLISSLVDWGASSESMRVAFCLALYSQQHEMHASQDVVETLLTSELDVDLETGECLRVAVNCGRHEVIKKLITFKSSPVSKSIAFIELIFAGHDEDKLIGLVKVFMRSKPVSFLAVDEHSRYLLAGLYAYPNSPELTKLLIEKGCDVDATVMQCSHEDYQPQEESVTCLIWSISQMNKIISSAVIQILIDNGDINFQTRISMVTPLILAARYHRSDIVVALLAKKARPYPKDFLERSALFYAARNGDVTSVKALLKAKSPLNDGSLHEASRELHVEVVETLIKAKQDLGFVSHSRDHDGRTALHEMLLKCNTTSDISRIEATIRALTKSTPLTDDDFFVALNNPNPLRVIKALLTCGMNISDVIKQVVYGDLIYYYSPTMYILHGLTSGPVKRWAELISELKKMGVQDKFYARGDKKQPDDHIGIPKEVEEQSRNTLATEDRERREKLYLLESRFEQRMDAQNKGKRMKQKEIVAYREAYMREVQQLKSQFNQEDKVV